MEGASSPDRSPVVVIISADTEWRAFLALLKERETPASHHDSISSSGTHRTPIQYDPTPFGGLVGVPMPIGGREETIFVLKGGWGKISAAASAQYAITRWSPRLLVNLGTCGGIAGAAERGEIVLVDRTVVYDVIEQMGDPDEAIAHYSTVIDLSWVDEQLLSSTTPLRRGHILSADRDLTATETAHLDWESGAIAWTAALNGTPLLILRGVTDLVGPESGEAYDGNVNVFVENAGSVIRRLMELLPTWLEAFDAGR